MTTRMKWVAKLDHVQEVSILGSADLGFWQQQLAGESLAPVNREGRASILIVSAAGRFMGVRFREVSVSVFVAPAEVTSYFLVRAFSSCSVFAFCERLFFSTPYVGAQVGVVAEIPTAICVTRRGRSLFHASMRPTDTNATRMPAREFDESLLARVYVPNRRNSASRHARMFFARIGGSTKVYPFLAGEDTLVFDPQEHGDPFRRLVESAFVPETWMVRSSASHAKSKTYLRSENVEF